ncbi:VanW family protein [Candidatus Poriferisocius sp.]|uniref:VanW family protein n=1 Tax=Candidatus Poriferisocius sp. TaxID=3101276 RepID=UPI003B028953
MRQTHKHPPLRLRRPPRPPWVWALMVAPAVLLAAWLVLWLIDSSSGSDKTPRGLTIEGPATSIDIGGLNQDEVTAVVTELAEDHRRTPVEIVTPSRTISSTAGEVGLVVDVETTVAEIMKRDRGGGNPIGWTASFFESSESELLFTLAVDTKRLADLEAQWQRVPVDPSIVLENGVFQVVSGVPGETLNLASTLPRLLESVAGPESPLRVEAEVSLTPPDLTDDAATRVAGWINQRTAQGLLVTVKEVTKRVQPAQLRTWLKLQNDTGEWIYDINQQQLEKDLADPDKQRLAKDLAVMNQQQLEKDLAELFAEVATVASEPVLTVMDDVPVLVSEVPALVCCQESASQVVLSALDSEQPEVNLELRELDKMNDQSWLVDRGIVELIGRFTTHYTPNQARVGNIHRIAEMIQGAVVYPGETFSVNQFVGQRTEEKGFVPAGVIYQGVYAEGVGGGISQFITTLFTAAFNAGMEFPTYQSHSLDIPRYRQGVDATISWPAPDFQLRNPNPYAVLLWPTVTGSSVTVSLYSTAHAEVKWTNRYDTSRRFCTVRVTQRSRTYSDGTVLRDSVTALYQPREGVNCDGACILPLLPLDGDGDGQGELDSRGLPQTCVGSGNCVEPRTPVDTNEDGRADLCTLPVPDPLPEAEPTPEATGSPEPEPVPTPVPVPEATPPPDPGDTMDNPQAPDTGQPGQAPDPGQPEPPGQAPDPGQPEPPGQAPDPGQPEPQIPQPGQTQDA